MLLKFPYNMVPNHPGKTILKFKYIIPLKMDLQTFLSVHYRIYAFIIVLNCQRNKDAKF